ncbi:uncharacterized protein [Physcomitrium patens]|uniref:uncharacterized protein isoform X2 n=1 Tax=Physcomitrium patens TaxID=3218 RepID=UPI000D17AE09|nr:uncharacterized protein LOC112276443 isoform X2 [Physcomitrium patens]|eukprot:XP_024363534.1 uncharacterized protein LOC112276443 isoform X2 [Physcomitrella patens]
MRCAQHNNFAHRLKLGENCDLDGSSCLQPSRQVLPRSDGCRMLLLPCKLDQCRQSFESLLIRLLMSRSIYNRRISRLLPAIPWQAKSLAKKQTIRYVVL